MLLFYAFLLCLTCSLLEAICCHSHVALCFGMSHSIYHSLSLSPSLFFSKSSNFNSSICLVHNCWLVSLSFSLLVSRRGFGGGAPGVRPLFALICNKKMAFPGSVRYSILLAPPGLIFSGSTPGFSLDLSFSNQNQLNKHYNIINAFLLSIQLTRACFRTRALWPELVLAMKTQENSLNANAKPPTRDPLVQPVS